MSKHTPGPWEIDEDGTIFHRPDPLTKYCIADMQSGLDANACLIAAAPQLLSLVRDYRGTIEFHIRRDLRDGDVEGANMKRLTLQYVEDAIAKAEGRS